MWFVYLFWNLHCKLMISREDVVRYCRLSHVLHPTVNIFFKTFASMHALQNIVSLYASYRSQGKLCTHSAGKCLSIFFLPESGLVWASSTTTASIGKGADTPPLSNVDVVGRIIDSQSALSIPLFLFKVNESVDIFCFLSALGFFFFLRGRGIGIDDDCKLKPRSSNKCKSASASASRNVYLEQMTLDNAISLQLFVIFKRTAHHGSFECTSKNKMHA